MEKQKPHFPLARVKELVRTGKVRITVTAQKSASEMGFFRMAVCEELLQLRAEEFYKSTTAYADAASWQDVYRHRADGKMLYVKLTVIDDVLVLSFKEL